VSLVLEGELRPGMSAERHAWWPVLAGLAAMYLPTCVGLAQGTWTQNAYAHGPIILILAVWLIWASREELAQFAGPASPLPGASLFAGGLLFYLVGRSQEVEFIEVASYFPVLTGLILMAWGWEGLRVLKFPLLLLLFLIPMPTFLLDEASLPVKNLAIHVVQGLFGGTMYAVRRADAMLQVGDQQMTFFMATLGLDCLPALAAIGVLYVWFTRPRRATHSFVLLVSMIPIAFVAGVLHTALLVLVTYHLGTEAGQALLHVFAGMLLFTAALLMLMGVDYLLRLAVEPGPGDFT